MRLEMRSPFSLLVLVPLLFACSDDEASPVSHAVDAGKDGSTAGDTGSNDTMADDDRMDTADGDATVADAPQETSPEAGCTDPCPFGAGLTWGCQQRFMYGVNYAWHNFAGDFGGIGAWSQPGISAIASTHAEQLQDMHDHGASVVRWWVFPDFRGDGIVFDASDVPTGLGPTTLSDVQTALALADQADMYLMLCLFSFDGFRPSEDVSGIWTPGLRPIVVEPSQREALLENVVRPFAAAVQASPFRHRMIAWDVINEPEWAMTGASPYGDQDYDPGAGLEPVTHSVMESFVSDVIGVLRQESDALVTVGSAARKWAHAWSQVDIDFYQFHMYPSINDYWPYTDPPSAFGLDGKPIVMGEFPMGELTSSDSYSDVVTSWYDNGFAGALSWQYNEASAEGLNAVLAFANQHPCETRYSFAPTGNRMRRSASHPAVRGIAPGRLCRYADGKMNCHR